MDKPTIFFSHSSKDKDLILPIKNKINDITGYVLNVFMSSDGQSIPFGRNWVHKIEDGLNNAQIMFIFITPNSLKSNWIYFEAGFAYAKNIEVIPVGIGVNISQLRAPLNLLQGFDIESADSLNNIISIINKNFNYKFKEEFNNQDYINILNILGDDNCKININDYFDNVTYEFYSQYFTTDEPQKLIRYNIDKYFFDILDYLKEQNIQYSFNKVDNIQSILTTGIIIELIGIEIEPEIKNINQNHKIKFTISTYNFERSFNLLKDISTLFIDNDFIILTFIFNINYSCLYNYEQVSSVIPDIMDDIKYNIQRLGTFIYKSKINFSLTENRNKKQCLLISFNNFEANYGEINSLIQILYNLKIIFIKK